MNKGFLTVLVLLLVASASPGQDVSRKPIADLIAALEKDQSKVVDLAKLTRRDFGIRPELWKRWLDKTSDKQLAQIKEDRRANDRAKVPEGWREFAIAIDVLQEPGDRTETAKAFREVFEEMPLCGYADVADELAILLDKMAEEDKAWREPKDLSKVDMQERIKYHVHHLRNVKVSQWIQPGICHVLSPGLGMTDAKNAAIELNKIGPAAIPTLIEILDDRRPIRSIGFWRSFHPSRTILRYQDAAIQILDELLPIRFYQQSSTGAYLSNESAEKRYQVITRIRDWHKAGQGKSESEKLWIATKLKPGIHPTIELLRTLAKEHRQEKEVLKELHAMYQGLHKVYRPFIVELMAELGDESKVGEVLEMLDKNEFQKYFAVRFPDDSAAFLNAQDAAKRLLEKHGKGANQSGEKK